MTYLLFLLQLHAGLLSDGEDILQPNIADIPLYDNAQVTLLHALKQQLGWFSSHPSVSKEAFSDLLYTLHHQLLPHGNCIPDSYDGAMRVVGDCLVKPKIVQCCPNDCVAFQGELADLVRCPKCGSQRYVRNKVPAKSFTYLPIGPRLVRLFQNPSVSEMIQSHSSYLKENTGTVFDIQQSRAWKKAYSSDGIFEGDARGLSLALCADGVNPFHGNHVQYSMCPIVLALLNLPRHIRYRFSNLLLVGIIPGPKEPTNMNIYVNVLVDELKELRTKQVYDAHSKESFNLKAEIFSYVLDYPGIGKLFHTMGSGAYQGCFWCEIQGTYLNCTCIHVCT